jgi:hopene-associated glycosyltransferase HpnB
MILTWTAFVSLCAWIYLAFFRNGYWFAGERLTDAPDPASWPEVLAVIPARNEAESVGPVLRAHLGADYPGAFSVVLVDDHSNDATAEMARLNAGDGSVPLVVIESDSLPPGWTGKLWAMKQGLAKAQDIAPGAGYVLFTDADILLAPQTLRRLVAKAEHERLALASLMARLDASGVWGGLLAPAFVYFFQKLYPFARVNDLNDNMAGAAGGCMLARMDALRAIGGVDSIRHELIDDCALARAVKDLFPGKKIWLGLAEEEAVSLRDNRRLGSVWSMVARTAYAQLRFSPLLLAGTLAGMTLLYAAPPAIALLFVLHRNLWALLIALAAGGLAGMTYWPTLKHYKQQPWQALTLPVAGVFYSLMTFASALQNWRGRGGQQKGRTY